MILKKILACMAIAGGISLAVFIFLLAVCGYILAIAQLPQEEAYAAGQACIIVSSFIFVLVTVILVID
jgi:hypothetical protein